MSAENRQKIDKNLEIRNRLLDRIESGEWKTGDKLPGARTLAREVGCCFTHLQSVIESLVQQGILQSLPRNGTFVRENWEKRLIQKSFLLYPGKFIDNLHRELSPLIRHNPALWITAKSQRAIYEIRVSHYLFGHHAEYMEITPIFDRLFPQPGLFFTPLLDAFRINGRLYGIPLLFSPRIIVFNRRIFTENNISFPRRNWSWEEFMECIWALRRKLPSEKVFPFSSSLFQFTSIAARFGAKILDPTREDPVTLDSPEMLRALDSFLELRDILGPAHGEIPPHQTALQITTRQQLLRQLSPDQLHDLSAVELPIPAGGCDVNVPGVELLCIRQECADQELAEQLIQSILSEELQNHIGVLKSGIPFLRSAAKHSLDPTNSIDTIFLQELEKPIAMYNTCSLELYNVVSRAVRHICSTPRPEAMSLMHDLAETIRFLLRIAGEE